MKLLVPPTSAAPTGVAAIAMVARAAEGGISDTHRTLLDAVQRVLLRTELDVNTLPAVDNATLAEHFADPALARQLIQGMLVVSLAGGPATPEQTDLISGFARTLGVDEPAVRAIEHLAHQELVRFILDLHRRSNIRDYIENQYRNYGGIFGVVRGLLEFKGAVHDPALAARFHQPRGRAAGRLLPGRLPPQRKRVLYHPVRRVDPHRRRQRRAASDAQASRPHRRG